MKNPGQASCPSTFFPKTPHTGTYIPYIHIIPINFIEEEEKEGWRIFPGSLRKVK
jgi:hypothetical protein